MTMMVRLTGINWSGAQGRIVEIEVNDNATDGFVVNDVQLAAYDVRLDSSKDDFYLWGARLP